MTTKPRLSDLGLHPGFVEDVVDDLLSSDIISKENVQKLKNDKYSYVNANIVIDMRHKQKQEKNELDKDVESIALKRLNNDKHNTQANIKCLKIIDKEIANTRKHLDMFQNQLKKKNDSLMSSICNLEKYEDQKSKKENNYLLSSICNLKKEVTVRRSPLFVNLNEDEIKHYFNLHLDQLEEAVLKNLPKDHSKIWHPFELMSPPIIKVTTTIKLEDFKQPSLQTDGLTIKELPEDIPICVKGTILPVLSSGEIKRKLEQRTVVPNNSPDLDLDNSIKCNESTAAIERLKHAGIGRYVNSWKYYVRRKKIKRLSEKMEFKVRIGLLKHALQSWSLYTKHCKERRQSESNQPLDKKVNYLKEEMVPLNKTILKNDLREIDPNTVIPIQQKTDSEKTIISTQSPNVCKKNLTARKNSVQFASKTDLKHPVCSINNINKLTFDDIGLNKEHRSATDPVLKTSTAVGVQTINKIKPIGLSGKFNVNTANAELNKRIQIKEHRSATDPVLKTSTAVGVQTINKIKPIGLSGKFNVNTANAELNKRIQIKEHRSATDPVLKTSTAVGVQTINKIKPIGLSGKFNVNTANAELNKRIAIQTNPNPKTSASAVKPCVKSKNFNIPDNLNIHLRNQSSITASTNILPTGNVQLTSPVLKINHVPTYTHSKPMLSHRILTPSGVGLGNFTTANVILVPNPVVATHPNVSHQKSVNNISKEPLANRYAAQEKIIARQMGIIEKQKQFILDLKAKQLETESKLSLKSAENQLAQAPVSFSKRLQPVMKTITGNCGQKPATEGKEKQVNSEIKDKSEILTKSLLERQELCKQLAEMTKMRKIRADEERERLKFEEDEKQRQEKKELRILNILKIKKEKQLALENARNNLAIKLKTKEKIEKAFSHFNNVLLKKAFRALKQNHFEVKMKTHHCKKIFQTNLLKKVIVCWKEEVQKSMQMKNASAEKHYSTKLIINCWNMWCRLYQEKRIKMQVSEDMFMLKLQERIFRRWQDFTAQQYLQTCCKMELAERLHRRQVLRQCFSRWRQMPRLMFVEREREQRRRAWRETVQQLIPDFSPIFAESDHL